MCVSAFYPVSCPGLPATGEECKSKGDFEIKWPTKCEACQAKEIKAVYIHVASHTHTRTYTHSGHATYRALYKNLSFLFRTQCYECT